MYQGTTAEPVTQALVDQLLAGVQLHDEPAPLAAVTCVQPGEHQLEIVLEQGKYHQVRADACGRRQHSLHSIAPLADRRDLLGIKVGEWCYLLPEHLVLLGAAQASTSLGLPSSHPVREESLSMCGIFGGAWGGSQPDLLE